MCMNSVCMCVRYVCVNIENVSTYTVVCVCVRVCVCVCARVCECVREGQCVVCDSCLYAQEGVRVRRMCLLMTSCTSSFKC
jgi:Iap family predicted aminopeptidase